MFSTREYPPETLKRFDDAHPVRPSRLDQNKVRQAGLLWLVTGIAGTMLVYSFGDDKQLFLLTTGLAIYGGLLLVVSRSERDNMLRTIISDLHNMPDAMRQLAVVQFFSWFALFAMWIYTTSAVTAVHFGSSDTASIAYNDGANWVGVLFAAYNGFAALAAMIIPFLVRAIGLRFSHLVNVWLGAAGLLSFALIRDPDWLLLAMVGVGFAWASILSLPYALLSNSLPAEKMGIYMGIFNFFIVIPQLLAASVLGFLLKSLFGNQPIFALVIGGVSLVIAGLCVLRVQESSLISRNAEPVAAK